LLSFGVFQLFAAGFSLIFWLTTGSWQKHLLPTTLLSVSLTVPSVIVFWKRYLS
jgi:hypothetical protein